MSSLISINFDKQSDGLIPAIVQDSSSGQVLMLGYMNAEALQATLKSGRVTFFSRSKNRLWVKGESSNNFLDVVSMHPDCDNDAILIKAVPHGPTCHNGTTSCFAEDEVEAIQFLSKLESILKERRDNPKENSYSSKLFSESMSRAAQKVGEEGVEVAIASISADDQEFVGEVADLWFHSLVLLLKKKLSLADVVAELRKRNK